MEAQSRALAAHQAVLEAIRMRDTAGARAAMNRLLDIAADDLRTGEILIDKLLQQCAPPDAASPSRPIETVCGLSITLMVLKGDETGGFWPEVPMSGHVGSQGSRAEIQSNPEMDRATMQWLNVGRLFFVGENTELPESLARQSIRLRHSGAARNKIGETLAQRHGQHRVEDRHCGV